ncbi:sulfatase-like hydrolase/transferase [Actinomadura yumaensis]|uniref:sulfatase-like hydrolase/transferase n=1 Tax=Actinomadura yumaensis TaxID=111807 RepID=UPI00360F5CA7
MLGAEQRRWLAALVAGVLLLAGCAETGTGGRGKGGGKNASAAPSERAKKPNIVYVLTDDLSWDLVDYMPNVKRLQRRGLTFSNYFVADTLCCPSRATILTGKYPHNTGVLSNDPRSAGSTSSTPRATSSRRSRRRSRRPATARRSWAST